MAQAVGDHLDEQGFSEVLMQPFKKEYSTLYQLMDYNLKGTLLFLKSMNILRTSKMEHTIAESNDGDDSIRTWTDFHDLTLRHLATIDGMSDSRLKQARVIIADTIHCKHGEKFPNWPSIDKKQSGYIDVSCSSSYEAESWGQKYQVAWWCQGTVHVENSRPHANKYECRFYGSPIIKVLYFDVAKLKIIENVECEMIRLKQRVDTFYDEKKEKEKEKEKGKKWALASLDTLFG